MGKDLGWDPSMRHVVGVYILSVVERGGGRSGEDTGVRVVRNQPVLWSSVITRHTRLYLSQMEGIWLGSWSRNLATYRTEGGSLLGIQGEKAVAMNR